MSGQTAGYARAQRRSRTVGIGALFALAMLTLGIVLAPPGSAHSRLVSSNPQDGAVLAQSPAEVSFTFDEQLIDGMNTISINDENGAMVVSAPVQLTGTVMSLQLDDPLAAGDYQAAYRVVSADGHAVMGAISFTVAAGASSPSSDQPVTASSSPASVASSGPSPTAASTPTDPPSGLPWVVWLIGAVAVAVIVVLVIVAMRRAPKDPV